MESSSSSNPTSNQNRLKIAKLLRSLLISYQYLKSRGVVDDDLENLILLHAEQIQSRRRVES